MSKKSLHQCNKCSSRQIKVWKQIIYYQEQACKKNSISGLLAVKMYHKEYISNVVLKWVFSLILWFKPILSVLSLHTLVSNFILISWPTLYFHMYSRLHTYLLRWQQLWYSILSVQNQERSFGIICPNYK